MQRRSGRCLVAKATGTSLPGGGIYHLADPTADAVVIGVVGVRQFAQRGFGYGAEQACADQLRCDSGREVDTVGKVAIGEVPNAKHRATQLIRLAIGIRTLDELVFEIGKRLTNGPVAAAVKAREASLQVAPNEGAETKRVQERAIVRIADGRAIGLVADAQPHRRGIHRRFCIRRQCAAAVAGVAALAGAGVEQRPLPCLRIAEQLVAGLEAGIGAKVLPDRIRLCPNASSLASEVEAAPPGQRSLSDTSGTNGSAGGVVVVGRGGGDGGGEGRLDPEPPPPQPATMTRAPRAPPNCAREIKCPLRCPDADRRSSRRVRQSRAQGRWSAQTAPEWRRARWARKSPSESGCRTAVLPSPACR